MREGWEDGGIRAERTAVFSPARILISMCARACVHVYVHAHFIDGSGFPAPLQPLFPHSHPLSEPLLLLPLLLLLQVVGIPVVQQLQTSLAAIFTPAAFFRCMNRGGGGGLLSSHSPPPTALPYSGPDWQAELRRPLQGASGPARWSHISEAGNRTWE